jgi:hypothetical protein
MSTQVAGVLRDPFERPLGNTDIDIRAITNTFAVLPGATVKVTTSAQGEYNFILEPANYAVSVILDGRAVYQGAITITSTTPPGTLPQLLKQAEMLSELPLNYAEYFQQVQATVKDDADRAEAAANGIGDQVDEAREYADQAQASAQSSQQSSQTAQQALADTQVIANKFQNLDDAVTETQQNAQQTQSDATQTASDRAAADAAAQRAEDAAGSAETVNIRNLRVPQSETINSLPAAGARANSVASFDANGQSTVTPLNKIATLDSNGKVPLSNIPAAAITEVFPVSSQAEMLELAADPGDVAIINNTNSPAQNGSYILMSAPASALANWKVLTNDVLVQLASQTGASKVGYTDPLQGSVPRTVLAALADRGSVKSAGAKGDGLIDDTQAIQGLVNSLSAAGGGTVFFPRGRYLVGSISMAPNVSFFAESLGAVTLIPSAANTVIFADVNNSNSHNMAVGIENIAIDCGTVAGVFGVKSVGGNRIHLNRCAFYGCAVNVEFDRGGNHSLSNIISSGSSGNPAGQLRLWSSVDTMYGAVFTSIYNYRVDGGSVVPAIYMRRAVGVKFTALSINDNTYQGVGVVVENDCQGNLFHGIIVGTGVGIRYQKGSGIDKSPICNIQSELDFDQCSTNSIVHNAGQHNLFNGGMLTSSDVGVTTQAVYFGPDSLECSVNNMHITGYYGTGGTCININGAKGTQLNGVNLSGSAQGVALSGDCARVKATGCTASYNVTNPVVGAGTGADMSGISGYKPAVVPPSATPVSGTLYRNNNNIAVSVSVFGSSIDSIERNGYAVGYSSGSAIILYPQETLKVNSSAAINWAWAPVYR